MRYVTTRGMAPPTSLEWALFDGLAPDGSLYVPQTIDRWTPSEVNALPSQSLAAIGMRVLRPYTQSEIGETALAAIVGDALNFPIPLKEIEPGVRVLELFHGPTLAFKDIGARVMARLISALHDRGAPTSVLVATSGDTGSAVAHAFYRVPHTRVLVLYPEGRVSPQQQAQMAMFNAEPDTNVRAYAVAGNFDDCQRLVKAASADREVLERVRVTSANSINIGRLLPQMVYYFHAIAQLGASMGAGAFPDGAVVSTPSGNFGNLTAGLMARRAGLPVARFVAATNVNDVVPVYLATGRFEPRPSQQTLSNAMDVGHPSNFDRMLWMYGGLEAMRADIVGSRHSDDEVRATIRRIYETRGYLLDPHSAIAYLGLTTAGFDLQKTPGVFLATAHPAKFHEVVESIVGREIEKPAALAEALARARHVIRIDASLDAVKERLFE
jgi:threonine synthase